RRDGGLGGGPRHAPARHAPPRGRRRTLHRTTRPARRRESLRAPAAAPRSDVGARRPDPAGLGAQDRAPGDRGHRAARARGGSGGRGPPPPRPAGPGGTAETHGGGLAPRPPRPRAPRAPRPARPAP